MVCTANDFLGWKDFPKGLRVLLLDEDSDSAAEIRSKLEGMDYIVSTFCNENDALSAISSKSQTFHVAIVEATLQNSRGSFKFLETAKDLPTIMTSNTNCLNTMMKCIALGAVEFLRKPLCEDKLKNIWQHVVHKAFNAGESILPESLKPLKESVASMLQLQVEHKEPKIPSLAKNENVSELLENDHEQSSGSDKYPAPSTPQLKQGGRLLDDGDCQEQTNCLTEKEEQDGESTKSVETTCGNSVSEISVQMGPPQRSKENLVKVEDDCAGGGKSEGNVSLHQRRKNGLSDSGGDAGTQKKVSDLHNSCGPRANRKKMKVDWTPELHKKFVQAVDQLGVDQAIPSKILELMKVEGLTRHNVASHLQKYRMHRRHILPKEDDHRWSHPREPVQQRGYGYYQHNKPIMAYPPPYHSNQAIPTNQGYPVWGQPGGQLPGVQMWGPPGYPTWQPADSWHWKPYPPMHADAWGCPVMPPTPHQGPYPSYPQNAAGYHHSATRVGDNGCCTTRISLDLHPAEEVIDMVVKEAISKPWLPLPLGLKPPSTDSVLAELTRQGIPNIPPPATQSFH